MLKHDYDNPFLESEKACRFCGVWEGINDRYCHPTHCQMEGCWKLVEECHPRYSINAGGYYWKCSDSTCPAFKGGYFIVDLETSQIMHLWAEGWEKQKDNTQDI